MCWSERLLQTSCLLLFVSPLMPSPVSSYPLWRYELYHSLINAGQVYLLSWLNRLPNDSDQKSSNSPGFAPNAVLTADRDYITKEKKTRKGFHELASLFDTRIEFRFSTSGLCRVLSRVDLNLPDWVPSCNYSRCFSRVFGDLLPEHTVRSNWWHLSALSLRVRHVESDSSLSIFLKPWNPFHLENGIPGEACCCWNRHVFQRDRTHPERNRGGDTLSRDPEGPPPSGLDIDGQAWQFHSCARFLRTIAAQSPEEICRCRWNVLLFFVMYYQVLKAVIVKSGMRDMALGKWL